MERPRKTGTTGEVGRDIRRGLDGWGPVNRRLSPTVDRDAGKRRGPLGPLAPDGGALLHAARYLAPGEAATAHALDGLEALVATMQPGYEAEVVETSRLLGMPVAQDFPRADRAGRMANVAVDDAPNLFLAGDWVGGGAMLSDAAVKSAREAAAAALKRQSGAA